MLFATLGVVFEEKTEGEDPEQKGLDEPQAASGHVGDAFVTAEGHRRNTGEASGLSTPRPGRYHETMVAKET